MPYLFETKRLKIPRNKDRRVKLTPVQREEIRENPESLSQRALAAKFGVSRRLVQFIQSPEKHAQNLLCRKERGGSMRYYNSERNRETIQATREYKKQLNQEGLLHE